MNTNITLAKGGTKERTVDIADIQIPDLWHCAMRVMDGRPNTTDHEMILEVWHLAHDLLRRRAAHQSRKSTGRKRASR